MWEDILLRRDEYHDNVRDSGSEQTTWLHRTYLYISSLFVIPQILLHDSPTEHQQGFINMQVCDGCRRFVGVNGGLNCENWNNYIKMQQNLKSLFPPWEVRGWTTVVLV